QVNQISLQPLREMIELRGTFQEILQAGMESEETKQDYYHMILTDENDVVEALPRLREYYPNIMLLDYDNTRTRSERQVEKLETQEEKSPVEIFETLYEQQNGQPMNEDQEEILNRLIREIWEEEV
ncbi:MAG: exonuclease SbcCD subunit D C-terminal domain-containing protein, partial [Eubacteriales bacterium]|nr:exonuclease SbcCD subunit D C-terminal domain-containing protein [Eubacteriales bacterium]